MKKGYLVLENGQVFEGVRFGADTAGIGELVFNTAVVGYVQTLTDPCYYGQIVIQTFPQIGNYGMIDEDCAHGCAMRGYVVREHCEAPSNFRCTGTLDEYLKEQGVPGLYGVDTRELTRIIRDNGCMNAMICDEVPADLTALKEYKITGAVAAVGAKEESSYTVEDEKYRAALIDYGMCEGVIDELNARGVSVDVLPAAVDADRVLAGGYDGVVLSEGPGDPQDAEAQVKTVAALAGKTPLFGIGLGHQLLAQALGGKTEKLPYGHRGGNQPAKETTDAEPRTYITGQNHGYAVVADSLAGVGVQTYINANDGSCEGMDYPAHKAFSVQFCPVYQDGPTDTSFIYDRFVKLMEENHAQR